MALTGTGECAEVVETQRCATRSDHPVPGIRRERALVDVPVGDVESRVAQHRMLEQRRYLVDPALIGEQLLLGRDHGVLAQPLRPEVEKRLGTRANRDKAQVEDPGTHDDGLAWFLAVAWQRLQEVRRQHDSLRRGQLDHLGKGCEDLDVRVQVHHNGRLGAQPAQQERLDGGREFGDRVGRGHPEVVLLADVQRLRSDNAVTVFHCGRATGSVDHRGVDHRGVNHRDDELVVGMVVEVRAREHPCGRQVVACDYGAGDCRTVVLVGLSHRLASP
jgi:hypothetical protein